MKPWLDDLSEEWISQPNPLEDEQHAQAEPATQTPQSVPPKPRTRLPRMRNSSGSFSEIQIRSLALRPSLKPRSALAERSASGINSAPSPSPDAPSPAGDRCASNSTSGVSTGSVIQNGTVEVKPSMTTEGSGRAIQDDPEWRRRLLRGEHGYGEQKDLFSPMGLENIFQKPADEAAESSSNLNKKRGVFKGLSTMPSSPPPWPEQEDPTHRRLASAEIVKGPDNEGDCSTGDASGTNGSVLLHRTTDIDNAGPRTVSGQIEFDNENFSPVYLTTNLKIGTPASLAVDFRGSDLAQRLRHLGSPPPDSDTEGRIEINDSNHSRQESSFAKLPDDSFPEDLPAGTPDLADVGRYVELKRGGYSRDGSFRRRPLSPSPQAKAAKRSPLVNHVSNNDEDQAKVPPAAPSPPSPIPVTPRRKGKPQYLSPERAKASGSPLKLFEAHDTFTSNRLQRRLSQLELRTEKIESVTANFTNTDAIETANPDVHLTFVDEGSTQNVVFDGVDPRSHHSRVETFGEGQLDRYKFPDGFPDNSPQSSESNASAPDDSPPAHIAPPGSRKLFDLDLELDGSPKSRRPSTSKRQGLTRVSNPFRLNRDQSQSYRDASFLDLAEEPTDDQRYAEGKRGPTSPFKNPTPKRRRTLHSLDSDNSDGSVAGLKPTKDSQPSMQSVIGRKRKDARHEHSINIADPDVLARRHILRPRNPTPSQRRRDDLQADILEATEAFILSSPKLNTIREQLDEPSGPDAHSKEHRALAVANEVAAFSMRRTQNMKIDARKRSVTTQDFLDEAVKIMDYIRSKGRPGSGLEDLEETDSESPIREQPGNHPSSPLTFSRPPSREGRLSQWREPNKRELDSHVMSHLRKFQEKESDDFMGSSMRSLRFSRMNPPSSPEGDSIVVQQDNIRITDNQARSFSTGKPDDGGFNSEPRTTGTHPSTGSSMGQTVATSTSRKSDHVATLAPEAVAHLIPEQIAGMSFDRDKNIWIRQKGVSKEHRHYEDVSGANESEEDPFGNIPDLTVDETAEHFRKNVSPVRPNATVETFVEQSEDVQPLLKERPVTRDGKTIPPADTSSVPSKVSNFAWSFPKTETRATSWSDQETRNGGTQKIHPPAGTYAIPESDEDDIEHEIKYFEDREAEKPAARNRTVRDITISISNPRPREACNPDMETEPEQYSQLFTARNVSQQTGQHLDSRRPPYKNSWRQPTGTKSLPKAHLPPFQEETDLSLLEELPPRNYRMQLSMSVAAPLVPSGPGPSSPVKGDVTFMLSDLPDFTLNQVDECELPDRVVVKHDGTKFSRALEDRYALGTAELVKALQDVEPDEPYWEDLREVDLHDKGLTNLHRLEYFCPRLEEVNVASNEISQVKGIPFTVRRLQVQKNCLTGLTSWATLLNLQHLDVSNNDIDSVDGLAQLVHLRTLKIDDNNISSLGAILQLDGLMELSAQRNQLQSVDFSEAHMKSLSTLNLRGNRLVTVNNLHCLPQIQHVDFDDNCIHQLPSSNMFDGQCKSLRSLSICRNGMGHLKVDGIFPNLESLHIDDNSLTSVHGLERLRYLRTLSARGQQLADESDSERCVVNMFANADVRKLYVSMNATRYLSIPQHLLNLQRLELASMGLKELPDDFGQLTPNIRSANLNFNSIMDLRPLLNIKRLDELLIAGNKLERLRTNLAVLGKLTTLTNLDMRENPLTVRFYAPTVENRIMSLRQKPHQDDSTDHFVLPAGDQEADQHHLMRLDDETRLRRRVHEMMLATSCKNLRELDGLPFDKARILIKDDIWQRLLYLGVIRRSEKDEEDVSG
ncbi:hypothetical protein EJ04DRAFT_483319 [Polyplosphaeria fusca]|uniref:Uncharacterized protein n=1 Tax=Polyplosphaeria fusca TaxID=682080 RepID=A0A9P4RAG7_9PLEO|nr:hypothetical protein EJ04DRAFT_483319 [Polyplosphaeria fusca]